MICRTSRCSVRLTSSPTESSALAFEIMNEIPQSLRNMIDARWREERMNALSIWFIVALLQFL